MLLMLLALQPALYADTTLYSCKQDGVAVLQDKPIEGCKDQKSYTYQTPKEDKAEGLRAAELKLIEQEQANQDLMRQRYSHVDDNVGAALALREKDRRNEFCNLYRANIETTLIDIARIPEDHLFARESLASLHRSKDQYRYYCGKDYPSINQILKYYDTRIERY